MGKWYSLCSIISIVIMFLNMQDTLIQLMLRGVAIYPADNNCSVWSCQSEDTKRYALSAKYFTSFIESEEDQTFLS